MMYQMLALAALATTATACPGSASAISAKCEYEVKFDQSCSVVQAEVEARLVGTNGWVDPKTNPGSYVLTSNSTSGVAFSRTTGDGQYTDLVTADFQGDATGCAATFCSQSQVFSIGDFDTNYCNSRNLYCNSGTGCAPVFSELTFSEAFGDCRNPGLPEAQNDSSSSCFR
jgi:hypothetical protein